MVVNPGGSWQTSIDGPPTGFSASALADAEGNINTDPMGMGAWMDAAENEESAKEFWDGIIKALNKLAPGSAQNMYNDGYGKFTFGLVYNLGPSNNSGHTFFSDGSKIEAPNSGGSDTRYRSTYTKISNFSDAYGSQLLYYPQQFLLLITQNMPTCRS